MELESKKNRPVIFGINRKDLTPEVLQEIHSIYSEVGGIEPPSHPRSVEDINETLDSGRDAEFRYGSRIDGHSKFWVKRAYVSEGDPLLVFAFSANLDPRDRGTKLGEAGRKMEEDFRQKVNKYLQEHGVAQKIS